MTLDIPVEEILARVPERARVAYTNLVTHRDSRFDEKTGWSCAYITQDALACEMGVSLRTTTRALSDLRRFGLVRVLAWPGAETETQIRVSSVSVASPFGPIRMAQEQLPHHKLVDCAIALLVKSNRELEENMPESE
ncbi:helix-turn-helix domain-containing protein [Streptomyces sp. NPDC057002]|uniref:helix-turn-helix domain-containing protein n=1 Tax=Streptomyces sp. NPDC057002 TaxID=3345992 RepID=UPI003628D76A